MAARRHWPDHQEGSGSLSAGAVHSMPTGGLTSPLVVKSLMGQVQWGNVAEWVGGLATAGAVLFAGVSVRQASRSNKSAQADRAWDEAMLVTAGTGVSTQGFPPNRIATVISTVHNGGKRPIHSVDLQFLRPDGSNIDDLIGTQSFHTIPPAHQRQWIQTVSAEEWEKVSLEVGGEVTAAFTDSNGLRWVLPPNHILRQIPKPHWWRCKGTKT
jgi:hypothetical protein